MIPKKRAVNAYRTFDNTWELWLAPAIGPRGFDLNGPRLSATLDSVVVYR